MLLGPSTAGEYHFTMKYLNADGSVGEMCGNGARCAAVFAHAMGAAPEQMTFLTDAGEYRAELIEEGARVYFPEIKALPERRPLQGPARSLESADFLIVGVPHAVIFLDDLDLQNIDQLGREVRFDPAFQPQGANANFAEVRDGVIHVRTYERGVEAETLACGTGSVATACCHAMRAGVKGPQRFSIMPTGGMGLEVSFSRTAEGFREVVLSGPARISFRGDCRADMERCAMMLRQE